MWLLVQKHCFQYRFLKIVPLTAVEPANNKKSPQTAFIGLGLPSDLSTIFEATSAPKGRSFRSRIMTHDGVSSRRLPQSAYRCPRPAYTLEK